MVSVASSNWKDLQTWKYCSLVLPNFEYCCLKCSCIAGQSKFAFLMVSYHNLALLVRVRQNLLTFWSFEKLWVSIQSLVLSRCASASSSVLSANSGLKYDQFNCCGLVIGPGKILGGWFHWLGWLGSSVGASKGCIGSSVGESNGQFGTWFGCCSSAGTWFGCSTWFGWSGSMGGRSGNSNWWKGNSTSSKLSESISITLFSIGTTLTCFGDLPGFFFPLGFLEESVTLLASPDLDLGLPTLGFSTGTHGVWCSDLVLGLPTLDMEVEGLSDMWHFAEIKSWTNFSLQF